MMAQYRPLTVPASAPSSSRAKQQLAIENSLAVETPEQQAQAAEGAGTEAVTETVELAAEELLTTESVEQQAQAAEGAATEAATETVELAVEEESLAAEAADQQAQGQQGRRHPDRAAPRCADRRGHDGTDRQSDAEPGHAAVELGHL